MSKLTRKLSKKEVKDMVGMYLRGEAEPEKIAEKFGVSYHNVNYHVTKHFEKIEKRRSKTK